MVEGRKHRFACRFGQQALAFSWLLFLLLAFPALAAADSSAVAQDAERRLQEIERLNFTAPWTESAALLEALTEEGLPLSPEQAYRIGLVQARNQALSGKLDEAIEAIRVLLKREVSSSLKIRALTHATNFAVNAGDYASGFIWLKEALDLLDETQEPNPRLLGIASYAHVRVGEEAKGVEFGASAVEMARAGDDPRDLCLALSDYALALRLVGQPADSERVRREQILACDRAGDVVFLADARRGVGRALLEQGRADAALPWLRQAIASFDTTGFEAGSMETRVLLAEALLATGREPVEAERLLIEAGPFFEVRNQWIDIERTQRLLSDVQERKGHPDLALSHLRRSLEAGRNMAQEARQNRLSFLQVQFDTRLKEHQIAMLESAKRQQELELAGARRSAMLRTMGMTSLLLLSALLLLVLWRASRERRRFRELSERDGLTGLYNHQHTRQLGQIALDRSRQDLGPFTAIVADIDHFKRINDRHGHAAGDTVLRTLGNLLREVFPAHAVLGRSGGEEFTILLPATTEQTLYLIEDLRQRILPLSASGKRIEYSLSFGVCGADAHTESLEDALRKADAALYSAKRAGRNRVVVASAAQLGERSEPGLVAVGAGSQPARHLSQVGLAEVEEADRVFGLLPHAAFGQLSDIRPDAVDLIHYVTGSGDEPPDLQGLEDDIMRELGAGRRVCLVFAPAMIEPVQSLVRCARGEGLRARIEPGVSAEFSLLAELAIHPGPDGHQAIDAQRLLGQERQLDNRGLLLIRHAGAGSGEESSLHRGRDLMERLLLDYPAGHQLLLCWPSGAADPRPRSRSLRLDELGEAKLDARCVLVVPPIHGQLPDIRSALQELIHSAGQGADPAT